MPHLHSEVDQIALLGAGLELAPYARFLDRQVHAEAAARLAAERADAPLVALPLARGKQLRGDGFNAYPTGVPLELFLTRSCARRRRSSPSGECLGKLPTSRWCLSSIAVTTLM